ncbi:hypothetical protein WP4W18E09_P30480 (plasmid) [Escherichia coli]|nr:hypothetical protein WP4W18E09_P30480 [Escherichia coli]
MMKEKINDTERESNKLKGRLNVVVIMQKNTSGFLWFSLLPD